MQSFWHTSHQYDKTNDNTLIQPGNADVPDDFGCVLGGFIFAFFKAAVSGEMETSPYREIFVIQHFSLSLFCACMRVRVRVRARVCVRAMCVAKCHYIVSTNKKYVGISA